MDERLELSSTKSDLSECGGDLSRAERGRGMVTGRADNAEWWLGVNEDELLDLKHRAVYLSDRLVQLETGVLEPLARELVPIAIVLGFVPIIVTMSLYLGLLVDTLLAFGYHQAHRIPPVRDMVQAFLSALVFAVICVVFPFFG